MTVKRLSIGLYGPTYFGGFSPFLNWWKTGAPPTVTRTAGGNLTGKAIWDAGGYLDPATGEIVNPAPADLTGIIRIFSTPVVSLQYLPNCKFDGESWIAEWDGSATVAAGGAIGTGATQTLVTANKLAFTFGTNPGNAQLTFTITNRNDPPRNIRVYQARFATNVANGEKFNPDWVAQIKRAGVLRFMGWMPTNNETITDFSQFADESYMSWCQSLNDGVSNPAGASQHGPKGSLHPSLICQLANLTGLPVHICFPYLATDALVTAVVAYMKANTNVQVTYEYCNELWNPGFWQYYEMLSRGARIWGKQVTAVTRGNPTVMTVPGHALTNGASASLYTTDIGYTSLNATNPVITVIDVNTVSIPVDTSAFSTFGAADTWLTQDGARNAKYAGYRAAMMMKIVRDTYADTTRWRGGLATQTVNPSWTSGLLTGVNYWLSNILTPANSLAVKDLFQSLFVTGYFGDVPTGVGITNITNANPGVVTAPSHGYSTGQQKRLFIAQGMTQLDNQNVTVTKIDNNTFSIGVDTTGYTAWASNGANYAVDSKIFNMMDQSAANFASDPMTYPTKYTYFSQQLAQSLLTGTCSFGYNTGVSVAALKATYWPAQRAIALANGMDLRQYEGGSQYVGDGHIAVSGIGTQFNEYLIQTGHLSDMASVYAASYKAFTQVGGIFPSKFVEGGNTSQFGTWCGIRWWKNAGNSGVDDTGNPVWQAAMNFNENLQPETWAVRFGA